MKLGHIGIPVKDIKASKSFYDSLAHHVGLEVVGVHDDFVGYGAAGLYQFYVHTMKKAISGVHVCFEVDVKEQVDAFHKEAIKAGGVDNGAPGIREDYGSTYYAAFVFDPDGNNIEAVCRN